MAEIFKCQRPDRSIYYQDRNCLSKEHLQIPIEVYEKPRSLQDIKVIEQQLARQRKHIVNLQKQQRQERVAALKTLEKEQNQRIRMRIKCSEVKRKIAGVSQQYRNGYTIKQGISLDGKLAKYKDEKLRYCKDE